MSSERNGVLLGLPDRFVAVEIETEASPAFDAAQYSFFGDLSAADGVLDGALEDCLEALQEEDGLTVPDYGLHAAEEEAAPLEEDEDLSVASIFRNQLGLGPAKTPAKRVDPDEDAGMEALLTDPLSVARKQLQDDEYDQRGLPLDLYPQPVLNASQPAASSQQAQSLFGDSPGSYSMFGAYNQVMESQSDAADRSKGPGAVAQSASQPQTAPAAPPSSAGTTLLQMLKKPPHPAKAMTLEELEARMLGSAEAAAAASAAATAGVGAPEMGATTSSRPGMLGRPLPGQPLGMPGAGGLQPMQGPRAPMSPANGPPPPGPYHPQMQPPMGPPPPPHGMMPPGPGLQQPHMHGISLAHGAMQQHMMMIHPPLPGPPGPGMYPPMMGGHMVQGPGPQPNAMYASNGMMQPPPPHQHHHNQGMMPPGAMAPQYGPGPMMQPRPMHFGPVGMGGPPTFMHDNYPPRPLASSVGIHGPMQGMPPRPGPYVYGAGPIQQGPQRPFAMAAPPPPPQGGGGPRPSGMLGQGAAGLRPPPQPWPANGQGASDLGQQFARGGPGPVALAAAAAAAGRAGGAGSGPGGRLGGNWMRPDDVEYVVRSMLYSVANGVPYVEDYYYQAFVHKHIPQPSRQQLSPGAFPMAAPFVPELLRDLSEDQMHMMRLDPSARAKFVEGVQGLGKIVLSNIRTPKVLMDLSDRGGKASDVKLRVPADGESGTKEAADPGRTTRPLEQEPLLAARIMIEDCMNLLLDVDDIDRLANHIAAMAQAQQRAAAGAAAMPHPGQAAGSGAAAATAAGAPYGPSSAAAPPPVQLRQRRDLLFAGINGAFRLPNAPNGKEATALSAADMDLDDDVDPSRRAGALGDGVLIRILALSKGRSVVARALTAIVPPASLMAVAKAAAEAPQPQRPAQEGRDGADAPEPYGSAAAAVATRPDAGAEPLLGPDAPKPYVLLWATLRNAWMLFGSSLQQGLDEATERPMLEATARLAAALRDALLRLPTTRDVVDAVAAFNAGCKQHAEALCQGKPEAASSMEATLLPLAQTRSVEASSAGSVTSAPTAWLGEALAALVTRASQLGLAASGDGDDGSGSTAQRRDDEQRKRDAASALQAEWRREFGLLHERMSRHLTTLGEIHSMALASSKAEALAVVRALCCRLLVNAMLQHATTDQAQQLRGALHTFAA